MRVAGPFTVESLSPHRMLGVDEHGELIDRVAETPGHYGEPQDFAAIILDQLRTAGVQQAHKEDRISFDSLIPWPGDHVCAEGRYQEGGEAGPQRRAGIFIGPEFGTVQRQDLVEAAREAAEAGFDLLIACAFNYEAHATEFDKLGSVPVLKARMNADLHMAGELKNTGQGNLFVIFGEPDIDVLDAGDGQVLVQVKGVDVFDPSTGEVRSDDTDGIACWFVDTDYDSESFFVRHAYFLGANDPYKALKTTLKAEIDVDAWATALSDFRPRSTTRRRIPCSTLPSSFPSPRSARASAQGTAGAIGSQQPVALARLNGQRHAVQRDDRFGGAFARFAPAQELPGPPARHARLELLGQGVGFDERHGLRPRACVDPLDAMGPSGHGIVPTRIVSARRRSGGATLDAAEAAMSAHEAAEARLPAERCLGRLRTKLASATYAPAESASVL